MLISNPETNFKQNKPTSPRSLPNKTGSAPRLTTKSRHSISGFNKNDFKAFKRMLDFTLLELFPEIPSEDIKDKISYINHLYESKGPTYLARYLKATHESLEHLVLGLHGTLKHEKVSLGKDNDHWPKWLGAGLKSKCLVHNDPVHIRYVLTLCSTRRLIIIRSKTYLKSITDAPTASEDVVRHIPTSVVRDIERFSKFVNTPHEIGSIIEAVKEGHVTTHPTPALEVSLKSGPNGVSMFSFPWDRAAILSHNLEEKLRNFMQTFYTGDIDSWLESKIEPYEELVDSNRPLHVGKISSTFEGGKFKLRIFAIVDSLTQSVLSPFHEKLMAMLRTIPEDCTFDHTKVVRTVKELHSKGHAFFGYADLSNASDAIDKRLYARIGNIWLANLGDSWVQLFDRDFTVPDSIIANWDTTQKRVNHVRYNTGQPMGALSSWPFMAFVHHTIVWSAFGSRKAASGKYLLLGDDIVIFDHPAYTKYCCLLDKLGISYTNNFSTKGFEFAKRVFSSGKEITGAYTAALWASRNTPELFAMEWKTLSTRGYQSGHDLPLSFRTLLKVSRKRFERCRLLMTVPYGTEIRVEDMAKFINHITGRSNCFLHVGDRERYVEAIKCFRQSAAILIQQQFQKLLDDAKSAISTNAETYTAKFRQASGLSDHSTSVMQTAIEEYINEGKTRIRYLERDLKKTYLGGTVISKSPLGEEVITHLEPTIKTLLRPSLPQIPRLINFEARDKHIERLKFRAEHQINIITMLRG